jgi:hypothetical protein
MDQVALPPLSLADVPRSSTLLTSTVFHAQMVTSQTEPRKFAREPNLNAEKSKLSEAWQAATHALLAHQTRSHQQIEDHAKPLLDHVPVLKNSQMMEADVTHAQLVKSLTQMTTRCACHHHHVLELTKSSEMRTIATHVSTALLHKFQVLTVTSVLTQSHHLANVTRDTTQPITPVSHAHSDKFTTFWTTETRIPSNSFTVSQPLPAKNQMSS